MNTSSYIEYIRDHDLHSILLQYANDYCNEHDIAFDTTLIEPICNEYHKLDDDLRHIASLIRQQ